MGIALVGGELMILVGTILYGYCGGHFGRDSYETKRVEAVGADWVVCRDESGEIHFACGEGILNKLEEYTQRPVEENV
jgi:hypothetical protein